MDVALEIGQIARRRMAAGGVEADAFVNLLCDGLSPTAVGGAEGLATAVGAALGVQGAVAVGAAEAGVEGPFLHRAAKLAAAVVGLGAHFLLQLCK